MRALEEVLINLVPHEAVERIANALGFRVLKALLRLDLEVLLSVTLLLLVSTV